MSGWTFEYLDLQITLRCNAACRNCIKFCNLADVTGLTYWDSDLSIDQMEQFCRDAVDSRTTIQNLVVTGGEPTVHPRLEEIVGMLRVELLGPGIVERLWVNSNRLVEPPASVIPFVVNYSTPAENPQVHNAVFVHPDELGPRPTFGSCDHYRKWRVVCNYQGYSLCCAADGYLRLFALEQLIIDRFPRGYEDFPLDLMTDVCQHCPFGSLPPLQRDVGRPVSAIYAAEADKNRAGRQIRKRLYRPAPCPAANQQSAIKNQQSKMTARTIADC